MKHVSIVTKSRPAYAEAAPVKQPKNWASLGSLWALFGTIDAD